MLSEASRRVGSSVSGFFSKKGSPTSKTSSLGSRATDRPIRTSGLIQGFTPTLSLENAIQQDSNAELTRLLSFVGCESVCRASRLTSMLRRGALIYANSAGSAATYDLSEVVEAIEDFISHNWAVPRILKFITLALYFNSSMALGVTLAVAVCLVALAAAGLLPINRAGGECSVFRAVLIPVFLVAMAFCRDWLWCMGHRGSRMFLDKTCIHQTDQALQRQGIEKLGAFLKQSKRMVVIYTDLYLTKIWTVYEVAAFLSVHRPERMIVLPTSRALTFLNVIVVAYVVGIVRLVTVMIRSVLARVLIQCLVYLLPISVYVYAARRWARDRRQIMNRVSTFEVRHCSCFVEADRAGVYGSIVTLLRASGHRSIVADASDDEVLDAFNTVVRGDVLEAVWASLGGNLFTYGQYILAGAATFGPWVLDDYALFAAGGMTIRKFAHAVWWNATWIFGLWPLVMRTIEISGSFLLDRSGCKEYLFVAIVFIVIGIGWTLVFVLHSIIGILSLGGNSVGTLLFILTGVVSIPIARCVCGPRCCRSPALVQKDALVGGDGPNTIGETTGDDQRHADPPQPSGCTMTGLGLPQPPDAQPPDAPAAAAADCTETDVEIGAVCSETDVVFGPFHINARV